MATSSSCASPVKRKREEACQDSDVTDAPRDVWGLCRWSHYVYIDNGYRAHEGEENYSLIITKKLYDMIHKIEFASEDCVGDENINTFDGTFSPATHQEISVLKKFGCVLGGSEYIDDILEQNKEKKGAVWFETAQKEVDKLCHMHIHGRIHLNDQSM